MSRLYRAAFLLAKLNMSTISEILSSPPNNFSTTLSGNVSSSGLTLALNDVTGLGTEGVGVIYQKDSDGNPVTSTIEFVHWTGVSSLNLTLTDTGDRGISGSASGAQAHNSGDTFEVWSHSAYYPLNAVTLSATQTLTNKTLTTPIIASFYQDAGKTKLMTTPNTASDTLATIAATQTLTNKRITKRITTIASAAEPTVNTDNCDVVSITALAVAITSMTTNLSGTPTNFQTLIYRIKDNATARAITWGASFEARGTALPTTTVISKVLTVGFIFDTVSAKWGCVVVQQEE